MDDGPGIDVETKPKTKEERAIEKLKEALTGYSPKSKNTLVGEAISPLLLVSATTIQTQAL